MGVIIIIFNTLFEIEKIYIALQKKLQSNLYQLKKNKQQQQQQTNNYSKNNKLKKKFV